MTPQTGIQILVLSTFPKEVAFDILKIKIPSVWEPRRAIWTPSPSGKFTCKSAYLTDQSYRFNPLSRPLKNIWKWIGKSPIHNRLKFLVWKVLNNILPTRDRLSAFLNLQNSCCLLCESDGENCEHIFLQCDFTNQVWFISKWNFRLEAFKNFTMQEWITFLFSPSSNMFNSKDEQLEFCIFALCVINLIWKLRNSVLHSGPYLSVQQISTQAEQQTAQFFNACIRKSTSTTAARLSYEWRPPITGWLKVNCDAAYYNGVTKSAFILRDHKGKILGAGAFTHANLDATSAEIAAIKDASVAVNFWRCDKVIFESDSMEACNLISLGNKAEFGQLKKTLKLSLIYGQQTSYGELRRSLD